MSGREAEFTRLLQEIRAGSQEAAQAFVREFGGHILRVIRRRLEKRLRPKFDSCDFMQDVFASFFRAPPPPEAFANPEALLGYLTALAQHKVGDATRQRLVGQRYNLNRENSLEGSARFEAMGQAAQDPTPSEVFQANEEWEGLLQGEPPSHQQILELLRQGHTHGEIAAQLGLSTKAVQRLLRKLQSRFGT